MRERGYRGKEREREYQSEWKVIHIGHLLDLRAFQGGTTRGHFLLQKSRRARRAFGRQSLSSERRRLRHGERRRYYLDDCNGASSSIRTLAWYLPPTRFPHANVASPPACAFSTSSAFSTSFSSSFSFSLQFPPRPFLMPCATEPRESVPTAPADTGLRRLCAMGLFSECVREANVDAHCLDSLRFSFSSFFFPFVSIPFSSPISISCTVSALRTFRFSVFHSLLFLIFFFPALSLCCLSPEEIYVAQRQKEEPIRRVRVCSSSVPSCSSGFATRPDNNELGLLWRYEVVPPVPNVFLP